MKAGTRGRFSISCRRLIAGAGLIASLGISGCALIPSPGDRFFADRDFEAARDAYLLTLDKHVGGRLVERSLYHLGLIYMRTETGLYDPDAARSALTRLSYLRPGSGYAAKATLLLDVLAESERLRSVIAEQTRRALEAERELESMQVLATKTEAKSLDTEKRADQLGSRIGRLQSQIGTLREELAATEKELSEREQELARLKSIDLGEPP